MKIQCDACEKTEAVVLCCADEAALCCVCDEKVHAANKLAGKHQRVPLLLPSPHSSALPTCDICQEKAGYFFCLEDRALLCRHCDIGIHTATPHGSSHQRFLITGIRVALQHCVADGGNTNRKIDKKSNSSSGSNGKRDNVADTNVPMHEDDELKTEWMWNEVFAKTDFDQCFASSEPGSSS